MRGYIHVKKSLHERMQVPLISMRFLSTSLGTSETNSLMNETERVKI